MDTQLHEPVRSVLFQMRALRLALESGDCELYMFAVRAARVGALQALGNHKAAFEALGSIWRGPKRQIIAWPSPGR